VFAVRKSLNPLQAFLLPNGKLIPIPWGHLTTSTFKLNGTELHKTAVTLCEHAMQVANVHGAQACSGVALMWTECMAANYASLHCTVSFLYDVLIAGSPEIYDIHKHIFFSECFTVNLYLKNSTIFRLIGQDISAVCSLLFHPPLRVLAYLQGIF
jgi:hypothetical protein